MRRLVVSFHVTVANYEYLVYWRFHEDGNIECEVRATGLMVTTGFAGERRRTARVVDQRTYAPFHQHFIVARLDLDVDGAEQHRVRGRFGRRPHRSRQPIRPGRDHRSTPARAREPRASSDYDWNTPARLEGREPRPPNAHGTPVAYKLVPTASVPPLLGPETPVLRSGRT